MLSIWNGLELWASCLDIKSDHIEEMLDMVLSYRGNSRHDQYSGHQRYCLFILLVKYQAFRRFSCFGIILKMPNELTSRKRK